MNYNLKFVDAARLIAIGIIGMILSVAIPIYIKINYDISVGLMVGLILTCTLSFFIAAYLYSKRNLSFKVDDEGLHTGNYGLIKWHQIQSLNIAKDIDLETLSIKLGNQKKIIIPSKINNSLNREAFVAFRNDVSRRVSEKNELSDNAIRYSDAYGKGYRFIGYTLTIVLIILTPYVLYLSIIGEITLKKLSAIILIYASSLPFIIRVLQNDILRKVNKTGANKVQL